MPEIEKPVPTPYIEDVVPIWFAKFINQNSQDEIFELIAAANYLDVSNLIELGCAKIGASMKDKSIPEIRKQFNIVNDFTPEEERSILEGKANVWGEEDDENYENSH